MELRAVIESASERDDAQYLRTETVDVLEKVLSAWLEDHDIRLTKPYEDALGELRTDFILIKQVADRHATFEGGPADPVGVANRIYGIVSS